MALSFMEWINFGSNGDSGDDVKILQELKISRTYSKKSFIRMIFLPIFLLLCCTSFSLVHGKPAYSSANRILAVFRDHQKDAIPYSMFFEDLKGILILFYMNG